MWLVPSTSPARVAAARAAFEVAIQLSGWCRSRNSLEAASTSCQAVGLTLCSAAYSAHATRLGRSGSNQATAAAASWVATGRAAWSVAGSATMGACGYNSRTAVRAGKGHVGS